MRPFIETFKGIIESTDILCQINDERYDALPKDLKTLYVKYDTAREEALESKRSPFLCKEDKEEALDKMHDAFVNFRTALSSALKPAPFWVPAPPSSSTPSSIWPESTTR